MSELGIALVGSGRHGSRYAHHARRDFADCRLVGLWRRDQVAAATQARDLGCRAFASYDELIADPAVAAVVVVVPPGLHPEILESAARHRKAVLLEKPAAMNLVDGKRLQAAVSQSGIAVMVAQTLRFNNVVLTLKREIPRIGSLHALRISQRFEPSRPGWVDDPAISGGGVMTLTGVHSFDMARFLTGMEVERVTCEIGRTGTTSRTEDNFAATLRMGDGRVLAGVCGSRATASRTGPIEIVGERATLIGDHALNVGWFVEGSSARPLDVGPPALTVRETLRAFIDALRAGHNMPITLTDGLRAVAVVQACYRAADQRQAVAVEAVD